MNLSGLGGHDAIELGVLGEAILEGQNDAAIEQQTFALAALRDIGELVRGDAQLFSQNLTVSGSLVEHVDVVAVLENVLDFLGSQQVFDVLRDSGWNAAPFLKRFQISTL